MRSPKISRPTRALSEYMAMALRRRLPAPVVEKAKHHILDTLAAAVSGTRLLPGHQALRYVGGLGGVREAGVVGTRIVTTAANAALANGMAAHADETDDSHFSSHIHPGAAIVPAALAVGEKIGCSGTAFLRAVVLGYDVGCRSTKALDVHAFSAAARSTHSFGGTFGAGAAAGALLGLDAVQSRHLLSYCAQTASGVGCTVRDTEHVEKAFVFSGRPAHSGVLAATVVASGFTGVDDVFDGDRNFLQAYSPKQHPEALADGLGTYHEIMGTNLKKWSVGSPIQAALDGLQAVMTDHPIKPSDVRSIQVRMPPRGTRVVDNPAMPDINLQHLFAVMLTDGTLTFASAHDASRMRDPKLRSLARRVGIVAEEKLYAPAHPRRTIVTVTTVDGRVLSRTTDFVRGALKNPMSRDEVAAKARDLVAGILGKRQADRLVEAIWTIEKVNSVRRLRSILAAATPRRLS